MVFNSSQSLSRQAPVICLRHLIKITSVIFTVNLRLKIPLKLLQYHWDQGIHHWTDNVDLIYFLDRFCFKVRLVWRGIHFNTLILLRSYFELQTYVYNCDRLFFHWWSIVDRKVNFFFLINILSIYPKLFRTFHGHSHQILKHISWNIWSVYRDRSAAGHLKSTTKRVL